MKYKRILLKLSGESLMGNENYGIDYNMGGITLGATMNKVTNDTEAEGWERSITEISVGYSLSDNASLSYHMASDDNGTDTETKYSWLTLTVTP